MEAYQELEVKFAEWNSLDPAGMVACSSGTAALHLALEAMNNVPEGRVILPDLTMVACPRAVVMSGKDCRFVDCGDDLQINSYLIESQVIPLVDTIMAVHIYGRTCDMVNISGITYRSGLMVVEDLAEVHGVRPHASTDAACWSFYKNKIVAGEEGGAVWFRDLEHAKLARQLRSLGFTDAHDFTHVARGMNYRLSNCHASLILPSLADADANLERRRQVERWYDDRVPIEWRMPPRDVVWVYDLRIPEMVSEQQDRLVREMNQRGVAARHCFKPMTTMPEWRGQQPVSPNALRLSREIIYLPVQPSMTEADVTRIVDDLMKVYQTTQTDQSSR